MLRRRQHQGGQPGSAGQARCVIPSGGSLTVAARGDVVLAQAALGHGRGTRRSLMMCGVRLDLLNVRL